MRWKTAALAIVISVLIAGVWVAYFFGQSFLSLGELSTEAGFESIEKYVVKNSTELESAAIAFLENGGEPVPPTTKLKYSPRGVDENGNVYFVVDWNTFATVGFVFRNGDSAILGEGSEPNVAETRHLVDNWWYYVAN